MADDRHEKLAETLVTYSCGLRAGEKVLIEAFDAPHLFTNAVVRAAHRAGAHPVVFLKSQVVDRQLLQVATPEQMELWVAGEKAVMGGVDAYIGIRGGENVSELSDVPEERMRLYESKVWKEVHMELRLRTRWVVIRWPSPSMAQLAKLPTEVFEEFFFEVCNLDYARMSRAMRPLQELMEATDRVRLVAPGTDLSFSIAGIPAVPCDGRHNLPDGEVFTAPVKESVNGTIAFNAASLYQGVTHDDVRLTFRDGKVVDATSSEPGHLRRVLDSDEGARYVGEFAIGFNPHITGPMNDTLFDEKISGSIHLTPGNAYDQAFNGNRSAVHWDLVLMMDEAHGGGEIWFDDRLVRKDGRFVVDELESLNPERLLES